MPTGLFARVQPSLVSVTETYCYHADIHGNPTIEEKGEPRGEIVLQVPYDGERYFGRIAYWDIFHQRQISSGDRSALIGYLAATNISTEEFWREEPISNSGRTILPLELPVPGNPSNLSIFIEDNQFAKLTHRYHPRLPDVSPRPCPVKLDIDIFDEFTIGGHIDDSKGRDEWDKITQEHSFDRNLSFKFDIEIVLPENLKNYKTPIMRLMQLEWPVATSYHMLKLKLGSDATEGKERDLHYNPEQNSVEWKNISLLPVASSAVSDTVKPLRLYRIPEMILRVLQPGELYNKDTPLICRLVVEIPDLLLSGMCVELFSATGQPAGPNSNTIFDFRTLITVDIEIDLKQRFKRKVLSPLYKLQFEDVMLTEERMRDIVHLLKDLGFSDPQYTLIESNKDKLNYGLRASKEEGPDKMHLWILATGSMGFTQRETSAPGVGYRTDLQYGNTEIALRAELGGDVRRLSQVMNKVHISLKELFSHTSDKH